MVISEAEKETLPPITQNANSFSESVDPENRNSSSKRRKRVFSVLEKVNVQTTLENFAESSSASNSLLKTMPSAQELEDFERVPKAALLSLAVNSGQSRFAILPSLFSEIASGNHIFDEPEAIQNMENLEVEIKREAREENLENIYQRFQQAFDKNAPLKACACCGTRTYDMGNENFYLIDLKELHVLRLSTEQRSRIEAINHRSRRAFSYSESNDKFMYHLHPEFITTKFENRILVESASLCGRCHKSCIDQKVIPTYSIANGIDFGDMRRVKLPVLSLVEQCVISRGIAFVVIVKLPGLQMAERQPARKGHVIVFPQPDAPRLIAKRLQRKNSSGRDVFTILDDLEQYVGVTFIGSKPQVDAFIPTRSSPVQELKVSADKVFFWLRFLKDVNPLYRDITIDDSEEMRHELENLPAGLLNRAASIEGETSICLEELVARGDHIEKNLDINEEYRLSSNEEDPANLPMVFITKEEIPETDETAPATHVFNSLLRTLTSKEVEETISTSKTTISGCEEQTQEETNRLGNIELESNEQNEEPCIRIPAESIPFNEFEANDSLLYATFPFLFLFGSGLSTRGSIQKNAIRHMMLQFHARFAACNRLIFCLFDQMQRHAASRSVAARVRNKKESFAHFAKWVDHFLSG